MRQCNISRRGFTLAELLVAILILSVLAALLVPMIGKALERGRQAGCVANLRQIGTAFALLLNDNGGRFPAFASDSGDPGVWYEKLRPYLGVDPLAAISVTKPKVLKCPANQTHEWSFNKLSYAYNIYLGDNDGRAGQDTDGAWVRVRRAAIVRPAEVILCADGDSREETYNSYLDYKWRAPGVIHHGGANILYVDGHVAWHLRSDVTGEAWTEELMKMYGAFGRYGDR